MSEVKKKICIIDFDIGNIGSVSNLLEKMNIDFLVSGKNEDIQDATHLILPGVGSFPKAIKKLKEKIDLNFLNDQVLVKKKPILGICIGMHLMAEKGTEFETSEGLGWIPGSVDLIDSKGMPLPHIGWNEVVEEKTNNLLTGLEKDSDFYFVNSYCFYLKNENFIIGSTNYGVKFPSVINKENIYGVQFHPEKSQKNGRKIILNFINV